MGKKLIIAIDGPAGAGKSTIARSVARRLGFTYIDTGAMYRSVALWALRLGVDPDDMHKLEQLAKEARIEFAPNHAQKSAPESISEKAPDRHGEARVLLNGEDVTAAIREPQVAEAASKVAACPGVRSAMRAEQRRIGELGPAVMEGRDIGTVVFPDARLKIYLDATPAERARRRAAESGVPAEDVAKEIAQRDQRDRTRSEAPLTQAPDAEYLDSSRLTPEQVEEAILKLVRDRTSNGKGHG